MQHSVVSDSAVTSSTARGKFITSLRKVSGMNRKACKYCEADYDSAEQLTQHLVEAHDHEELGRIDRRRVEQYEQQSSTRLRERAPDVPLSRRAAIAIVGVGLVGSIVGVSRSVRAQTQITDWNDLDDVRKDLGDDYHLANDLTPETDGYEGIGDDFEPIGSSESFKGTFNGDGHTIKELQINKSESNLGLFGTIGSDGLVENVVLQDVSVSQTDTSGEHVGGLFGVNAGEVNASIVTGDVSSTSEEGDSFSPGSRVGGLGGNNQGSVSECAANVTVDAPDGSENGGLVGILWNGGEISDSYVLGSANGENDVGGLVGILAPSGEGDIHRSYATGNVHGDAVTNDTAGGLVGLGRSGGTVEDSYWDRGTTNRGDAVGDDGGNTTSRLEGFGDPDDTEPADEMTGGDALDDSNMEALEEETWQTVVEGEPIDNQTPAEDGYPILQAIDTDLQLEAQGILFDDDGDDGPTITISNSTISGSETGIQIGSDDD